MLLFLCLLFVTLRQSRACGIHESAVRARPAAPALRTLGCGMEAFEAELARAEGHNADANALFRSKLYDEAAGAYSRAVAAVEVHAQRITAAEAPLCKYLCNRAAAFLAAGYHSEALKDCDVALSLSPDLDKAVLRRALAREALGKLDGALADAQILLGRTTYGSALHARALDLKRRVDRLLWHAARDTESASNRSEHLFTSDQTLRLNFRTPPPGAVAVGDFFEVAVFVANEFGLFGAKAFQEQKSPVLLDVSAIGHSLPTLRLETRGGPHVALDSHGRANFYLRFLLADGDRAELARDVKNAEDEGGSVHTSSVTVSLCSGHVVTGRGVVAVASLPIRLLREGAIMDPFSAGMAGCWSGRPVTFAGLDVSIIILECPDHGIPGKVWDGGFILAEYLSLHPDAVRGKRCVEVGAGTGVVGITAACMGASAVTLTDLAEHVSILEANLVTNRRAILAARGCKNGGGEGEWDDARAQALRWGHGGGVGAEGEASELAEETRVELLDEEGLVQRDPGLKQVSIASGAACACKCPVQVELPTACAEKRHACKRVHTHTRTRTHTHNHTHIRTPISRWTWSWDRTSCTNPSAFNPWRRRSVSCCLHQGSEMGRGGRHILRIARDTQTSTCFGRRFVFVSIVVRVRSRRACRTGERAQKRARASVWEKMRSKGGGGGGRVEIASRRS